MDSSMWGWAEKEEKKGRKTREREKGSCMSRSGRQDNLMISVEILWSQMAKVESATLLNEEDNSPDFQELF